MGKKKRAEISKKKKLGCIMGNGKFESRFTKIDETGKSINGTSSG